MQKECVPGGGLEHFEGVGHGGGRGRFGGFFGPFGVFGSFGGLALGGTWFCWVFARRYGDESEGVVVGVADDEVVFVEHVEAVREVEQADFAYPLDVAQT